MIYTVTFNPAVDKTAVTEKVEAGTLHRLHDIRQDAGGKGINVSKTLKALGAESCALGFVAGTAGQFIEEVLNDAHIQNDFVHIPGQTRTNLKVLDSGMVLSEFNEPGPEVTKADLEALLHKLETKARPADLVILSGNVGPGIPDTVYETIIARLKEKGTDCVLDADGKLFANGIKAGPLAIKPNRFELCQYFGLPEDTKTEELIRQAKTLLNENTRLIVISMGQEGSIFITADKVYSAPALSIPFKSSVGAGDAMVAAIALGLEQKLPLEELAKLAVATSAGACLSDGTSPADLKTVNRLKEKVTLK